MLALRLTVGANPGINGQGNGFGATFFIATMKAIGRETVNLGDV